MGLDAELEFACLRAAISEARGLGAPDTWLSLNLSPAVLVSSAEDLALALSEVDRPVVLELTEHMVIDGYGPVREALQRLGPDVKLAVDDAGSGFASLRHILELRPDFVKLDTSLVRDVHLDPVRQAMIAGLASFASRTKCHLIAEGVESEAELQELRSLGIPYVQGFLVGRPVPAPVRDSEIIRLAPHSERRRAGQAAKIG